MDDLYIGLMSGTSVDAVDAVLVGFTDDTPHVIQTHAQAFDKDVRNRLQQLIGTQQTALAELAQLDHAMAVLYTLAVKKLLKLANMDAGRVRAIGAHGQTIYHQPDNEFHNSLQIGDPAFLAEHSGIDVVADFRRHDMAAGGQGAPLVPAFHAQVFQDGQHNRVILNLGGIANITVLPARQDGAVTGFDTGPANTLLDLWASKHLQKDFDENGQWASQGSIVEKLLAQMLADPYFVKPPPRSTGREYFNLSWLEQFNPGNYNAVDVQTTLVELTCHSVANAIRDYARGTQEIYFCGGGARNTYLIQRLAQTLPSFSITSTEKLGLHPDWIEATAFAWLARQRILQRPGNLCSVTGASKAVVLGAVYTAK